MPTTVDQEIVVLSEGQADKAFLSKLIEARGRVGFCCFPFPNNAFHGASSFGRMLSALKGDSVGFDRLKGVIIVADSCDDPQATFKNIRTQIAAEADYSCPQNLGELSSRQFGIPVAVLLLPDLDEPGGLETLYYREMSERMTRHAVLVDRFISQTPAGQDGWNAEKVGKAKYATIVATTHRDDPSRAAAYAFREPQTVHVDSTVFDAVWAKIGTIIDNILK